MASKSRNNPLCRVGTLEQVDLQTGERVPVEGGGLYLLPPAPGLCEWCATEHGPGDPHNQQSLYYRTKFRVIHGRSPTWSDAMAHCTPEVRALWRIELVRILRWNGMAIPEDLR